MELIDLIEKLQEIAKGNPHKKVMIYTPEDGQSTVIGIDDQHPNAVTIVAR